MNADWKGKYGTYELGSGASVRAGIFFGRRIKCNAITWFFIHYNYSVFDAVRNFFRINNMASEIVYINVAVIVSYIILLHLSQGSLDF